MRILIYDPFAGISGDMNIGAMVSLGVPEDYFRKTVDALHLHGAAIDFRKDTRKGISGIRALVSFDENHGAEGRHRKNGNHKALPENHGAEKSRQHHGERNLETIKKLISESSLGSFTKKTSIEMFELLAEAEAEVHGKDINDIHFHETGAVDSIIDIVCAAAAIEYLKPDRIICRPVELGSGTVTCAHGLLTVPAHATADILKDIPVTSGRADHEATTHTGAVIVKKLADEFTETLSCRITKTGYGIGSRDRKVPNVLRVMVAEADALPLSPGSRLEAAIINCNIDDMNPELYSNVMDRLFSAGAKEVFMTPVYMKKNRPGTLLTVMAPVDIEEKIKEIIFLETTTAGLRSHRVRQDMLEREEEKKETPYGSITVKKLYRAGRCISVKPEYREMLAAAEKTGIPLRQIYRDVLSCL